MWGEEEIGDVYGVLQMALLEFLDRPNKLIKNFEDKNKGEEGKGKGEERKAPDVQVAVAGVHEAFRGVNVDGGNCFRAARKRRPQEKKKQGDSVAAPKPFHRRTRSHDLLFFKAGELEIRKIKEGNWEGEGEEKQR